MHRGVNFAAKFDAMRKGGQSEVIVRTGGVAVRLVCVEGGGDGRWDKHDATPETVVVWSGDFNIEFRDATVRLSPGQCCVIPAGVEHRGTSTAGAEVILFTNLKV